MDYPANKHSIRDYADGIYEYDREIMRSEIDDAVKEITNILRKHNMDEKSIRTIFINVTICLSCAHKESLAPIYRSMMRTFHLNPDRDINYNQFKGFVEQCKNQRKIDELINFLIEVNSDLLSFDIAQYMLNIIALGSYTRAIEDGDIQIIDYMLDKVGFFNH